MEIPFIVQFTPEENTDYVHNLLCETERERFIVPIRVIGARGFIDISDEIAFVNVPVKLRTTKTVLVRNIGDDVAKFEIHAEEPFSCDPESGCLPVGESMQLNISYSPMVSLY
jgi:hydrocephalus-inducing protein